MSEMKRLDGCLRQQPTMSHDFEILDSYYISPFPQYWRESYADLKIFQGKNASLYLYLEPNPRVLAPPSAIFRANVTCDNAEACPMRKCQIYISRWPLRLLSD